MYACKTWASMKSDKLRLLIIERKISRKIYGPTLSPESGSYERSTNENIENIFNRTNKQKCLEALRLEWAGHVRRTKDNMRF